MASFSSSIQQQNHNSSTLLLQSSSSLQQQQLTTSTYYSSPPSNNNNSAINKLLVGSYFEEPKSSLLSHFNNNSNGPNFLAAAYNSNNTTVESSSVLTALQQKKDSSMERKRKSNVGSSSSSANYSAQSKGKKVKKKAKDEGISDEKNKSNELQKAAAAATGAYIHVRARRGQATDSHSLAERVRREKISERMKQLQALVPGCEKVTGKALMLDEIINYVQSLQNQVEFLSMKLASINPISYDFGIDLESFMVRPHQDLNNLPSTITQGMQQMSPIFFTADHYPIFVDNSANNNNLLLHHAHISNDIPQDHRQGLWEVDAHRYKATNQSGVSNSGLFSFK